MCPTTLDLTPPQSRARVLLNQRNGEADGGVLYTGTLGEGGRGIHFILADHRSRIVILNWGTCGNTWKQFWLSQLGEECYWHLMDEGQGYC